MIKGMSSRWLALMALAAAVSSVSSFLNVGGVFREAQVSSRRGAGALMARLPPEFRNSKAKREIAERQRAMAEFNQEIETTPVFQVFAGTTKMRGLWYPVAAFKADNVAKGVVDAYLTEGFVSNMFKDVYKAQIETAVSKAIFDNEKKLREQGSAQHAPLKNCPRDMMVYGYKILYKPMQDKEGKNTQPTMVTRDMSKSLFDKFKDAVGTKVQETFSLTMDEPSTPAAPAAPAPKKKKGKKAKSADSASSEGTTTA